MSAIRDLIQIHKNSLAILNNDSYNYKESQWELNNTAAAELQALEAKLSQMQEFQERRENVIETLRNERDAFKKLLQQYMYPNWSNQCKP